jgi:hypothetical protein
MECSMRYFNPQDEAEIACSVAPLNGPAIDRGQAVSTAIVTCLAMLAWSMTSLGMQLASPLGSAVAVALLAAMGNHLYQWTIGSSPHRANQVPSDQLDSDLHQVNSNQVNPHQVPSRTRSAA